MDLLLGLLCLAVATVFAVVIYFISVSSMKEKTYDEVKAEQKKKAEEYLSQGRTVKDKAKDKKLKKAGKKVKEKTTVIEHSEMSSEEADTGKGHVAFVEPPVIVDKSLVVIDEKRKKKNKKKPILVNKNEPALLLDVSPPVLNHFEKIMPKDDFELKRSHSRDEGINKSMEELVKQTSQAQKQNVPQQTKTQVKPKEQKTEKPPQQKQPVEKSNNTQKNAEKPNAAKITDKSSPLNVPKILEKPVGIAKTEKSIVEEKNLSEIVEKNVKYITKQVQVTPANAGSDQSNGSPSTKTNKKKRSELATLQQMSGDRDGINVNLLMPLVHKAELSRSEIQVLIDVLLNKQQGSQVENAEWIEGRQDPIVKLKKQLADKEKALTEEQEAGVGLQNKLKELRLELNSEKHASRQLEETLLARQAELTGLATRLQLSTEEKQALALQLQQLQAKLSEDHLLLCKFKDEQGQAQGVLQQELLNQRQQLEMHIARLTEQHQETLAALEAQLGQLAVQLQEKEAMNASLSGELSILRERGVHLQDSAVHSHDLARQLKELHSELEHVVANSQFETGRLQGEISSLNEQLNVKRVENEKLNSLIQNLQTETQRLRESNECLNQKVSSAYVEVRQLRDENETLAAQMTASMERPATEGRENGDANYTESRISLEKQNLFQEKEKLLEQLNSEVALKESCVEKLTGEINNYKTELAAQELLVKSLYDEIDRFKAQLSSMEPVTNKEILISEINAYKTERSATESLISSLRGDVDKYKTEVSQLSNKLASTESLVKNENVEEKLISEINTLKTILADKESLITTLNENIDKYKADVSRLSSEISAKEKQVEQFKTEVKSTEAARISLTEELNTQRSKNDDLRKKNWKVMEAMSTTENTLKSKLNQTQSLVSEAAVTAKTEEQSATREFLSRIFPDIVIDNKKSQENWLEYFADTIKKQVASQEPNTESQNNDEVLAELEKQNTQLQTMVTNYKTIIADTEGMLNRLQNHVEQEESRWGQQIQALETQLEAVKLERDRLEENSDLAAQLESTLSLNKEQSKELARLRSLVQIGQDTYNEEHKQVLFLQQEVASIKAGEEHRTSNGLTNVDTASQTLHKRQKFTGWLRNKLRSSSRSRRRSSGNTSA